MPIAKTDLEGEIAELSGSCPDVRFRVRGVIVWANRETDYRRSSCRDLRDGRRAEVKASIMSDRSIRADRIEVRRRDDDDDDD